MKNAAIFGASGYTGAEAVRLLLSHPNIMIKALSANRHAGEEYGNVFANFAGQDLPQTQTIEDIDLRDIDVVFVENSLRTFLNDYRPGEFVRFYSGAEAQASGIATPDQIVDMKFDGFAVGQSKGVEKSKEVRKDNVVIGQTRSNPPQDVVGSVKATVITYKRTVSSNAQLDFIIREGATGRVLRHKKLPGSYMWEHEWGTFRGDERAVPANLKTIVTQRDEQPPGRQELFVGFAEPIFQQACAEMKDFYQRYR